MQSLARHCIVVVRQDQSQQVPANLRLCGNVAPSFIGEYDIARDSDLT